MRKPYQKRRPKQPSYPHRPQGDVALTKLKAQMGTGVDLATRLAREFVKSPPGEVDAQRLVDLSAALMVMKVQDTERQMATAALIVRAAYQLGRQAGGNDSKSDG